MDEPAFPAGLQVADQDVMHHPVPKVGGEYLAPLGFLHQKGHGPAGPVAAARQFLVQGDQVLFQVLLEAHGVDRAPLALAALAVGPVDVFQAQQWMVLEHLLLARSNGSSRTGYR